MYKIIYFGGSEMKFHAEYPLSTIKMIAEDNKNIYQIVRDNRTEEIIWERECEDI